MQLDPKPLRPRGDAVSFGGLRQDCAPSESFSGLGTAIQNDDSMNSRVRRNSIAFRNKADAVSLIRIGKEEPLFRVGKPKLLRKQPTCFIVFVQHHMQPEGMILAFPVTRK